MTTINPLPILAIDSPLPELIIKVSTSEESVPENLLEAAASDNPLIWFGPELKFTGIGRAAHFVFRGKDRFAIATRILNQLKSTADIQDQVKLPGSGLVTFFSFSFDDDSESYSQLIVPERILVETAERSWVTEIEVQFENSELEAKFETELNSNPNSGLTFKAANEADAVNIRKAGYPSETVIKPIIEPVGNPGETNLEFSAGALSQSDYQNSVRTALADIEKGQYQKVVLARDLVAQLPVNYDLRFTIEQLQGDYPSCWIFAVEGLIGASPETLLQVRDSKFNTRVLAGSVKRNPDPKLDSELSEGLLSSAKNLAEHEFVRQNAQESLSPLSKELTTEPVFLLKLANLSHLASDIHGTMLPEVTALELLEQLHPTAAVAGTPTGVAQSAIRRLEGFDRGRYSGPVGWIDSAGNSDFAIALRCAQFEADGKVTAFAGCGIVAGSDPESEMLETRLKFQAILTALNAVEV